LFPSFPVVAPFHTQPTLTNTIDFQYFALFNVLGFPVTQCPMGLNDESLPTGVQVIASHLNDHLTIALAEHFEENLVGWTPPFMG
jgi:fatty acid amide hydrolase 2